MDLNGAPLDVSARLGTSSVKVAGVPTSIVLATARQRRRPDDARRDLQELHHRHWRAGWLGAGALNRRTPQDIQTREPSET
jgi:hypothetical protein